MNVTPAAHLDDVRLTTELARLAIDERNASVAFTVYLAEFDARRLYEPAGFSSRFTYCRKALGLSEDAIYSRIEAARAGRRSPLS